MSRGKNRPTRRPPLRGWLALLGMVGALGVASAAQASVARSRDALEARVLDVRATLLDAYRDETKTEAAPPEHALIQWFKGDRRSKWNNWPNWGNWSNWFNR